MIAAATVTMVMVASGASHFPRDDVDAAQAVRSLSPVADHFAEVDGQVEAVSSNEVIVPARGAEVRVTLPVGSTAESAVSRGLVELSGRGYSVVPAVLRDGSVAIHTVMHDASAPLSYDFYFHLPANATLQIDPMNGSAIAVATDGSPLLYIATPWARDARGRDVPTYYSARGSTLTQHLEPPDGASYPIVADPWAGVDLVGSFSFTKLTAGWKLNVNPTLWARGMSGNPWALAAGEAGWDELKSKMSSTQRARLTESGKKQYVCHMLVGILEPVWNMELWKPNKGLSGFLLSQCN